MASYAHSATAPSTGDGTKTYRMWVRRAACSGRSDIFEQPGRASAALAVCARCPVLGDCRQWALHHAVAGVAGGLTAHSRRLWRRQHGVPEPAAVLEDFLSIEVNLEDFGNRAIRTPSVLRAVAKWTDDGESARQIASRLGCSSRRVQRLRTAGRRLEK